jgi:two-component system sensor histidine kinase TtrS
MANAAQIQQILLNLLTNAADAMQDLPALARAILVETGIEGTGARRLAVQDSGPGLSPKAQEEAFAPLFTTKCGGLRLACRSFAPSPRPMAAASASTPAQERVRAPY